MVDLEPFLRPADPGQEPDVEGAAAIGDRIYWVGLREDLLNAPELREFNLARAATRAPEAEGGLSCKVAGSHA
jgi:hypothetical protein